VRSFSTCTSAKAMGSICSGKSFQFGRPDHYSDRVVPAMKLTVWSDSNSVPTTS